MATKDTNRVARIRRHARIRKKVAGTPERPRLAVFRSNAAHLRAGHRRPRRAHARAGLGHRGRAARCRGDDEDRARARVGALVAQRAKEAGVETVVFDRGGFAYAGRVKALADAARAEGLVF